MQDYVGLCKILCTRKVVDTIGGLRLQQNLNISATNSENNKRGTPQCFANFQAADRAGSLVLTRDTVNTRLKDKNPL